MKKHYTGTLESVRTHTVPEWYHDYKFGIFIHWGLYSVPAYAPRTWELGEVDADEQWFCNNPYAEWYYNSVNVGTGPTYEHHINKYGKDFSYENFADMWKAENWNPAEWAELFKNAGARYVVLVTKHHDGFCLFPSDYTDYNASKRGPCRDIVGELTYAVRNTGLKMGLYYSGIIDWRFAHDPIFTEDENFTNACPTFEYGDYAYKQSCELIDRYKPSVFWNDIGWPKQSEPALPYLLSHYYNTVEDGVVNDRFNGLFHDFSTKEYQAGVQNRNEKWEMCRGMGLSFGYNQEEGDDKLIQVNDLLRLLVDTVSNNGNLLLNIGPKADGTLPKEQISRLLQIGNWLTINGEGIYETRCSKKESLHITDTITAYFTAKNTDLYIFIDGIKSTSKRICIPDISNIPELLDPQVQFKASIENGNLILDDFKNNSSYEMIGMKLRHGEA